MLLIFKLVCTPISIFLSCKHESLNFIIHFRYRKIAHVYKVLGCKYTSRKLLLFVVIVRCIREINRFLEIPIWESWKILWVSQNSILKNWNLIFALWKHQRSRIELQVETVNWHVRLPDTVTGLIFCSWGALELSAGVRLSRAQLVNFSSQALHYYYVGYQTCCYSFLFFWSLARRSDGTRSTTGWKSKSHTLFCTCSLI